MKKTNLALSLVLLLLTSASVFAAPARRSATNASPDFSRESVSDPGTDRVNAISLELLGKSGLYNLSFDHMFSDQFALGIGIEYFSIGASSSLSALSSSFSFLVIPISTMYYFTPGAKHFYLIGGVNFAAVSGSAGTATTSYGISGSGIGSGFVGAGYEYRGDGGFLFRVAPYFIFSNTFAPWIGATFGYAF